MGIIAMESFKYLDAAAVALHAGATSPGTLNRVSGRDGRYGVSYTSAGDTSDNASRSGYINVTTGTNIISFGYAAWFPDTTPSLVYNTCGIAIYTNGTNAESFSNLFVSTATGGMVGERTVTYSGASDWTILDSTPTTPGWHWFAVDAVLNSSSSGYIRVYRDGVLMAELGPDTAPSGSCTGTIGIVMGHTTVDNGAYFHVSDLIVRDDNTVIPDTRVDSITLAATTQAQWTGSDADQVDNHLLLNDAGPTVDTATYVRSDAEGQADIYTPSSMPSGTGTVHAVATRLVGASVDTALPVTLSMNGTDAASTFNPSSGATKLDVWETNPSTGLAWEKAEVASAAVSIST
jgi:hypothetical protein